MAGWTFEPAQCTSSLEHLGERLRESLAPRDEAGVEIEKIHVAPVALKKCQPVPSGQVVEEARVPEGVLVNGGAMPGIEKRRELVKISTQKKLEPFWLVETTPQNGFDLTELLDPENVCAARPVKYVPPHEMVSSARAGSGTRTRHLHVEVQRELGTERARRATVEPCGQVWRAMQASSALPARYPFRRHVQDVIDSKIFSAAMLTIIFVNTFLIALQTDQVAQMKAGVCTARRPTHAVVLYAWRPAATISNYPAYSFGIELLLPVQNS